MFDILTIIPQGLIIIGLLLIFTELFIGIEMGFDLVLIGSILLISGLTGSFLGNIGFIISLILAIVLSILYIAYGRSFVHKKFKVTQTHTNVDQLIGKTAVVITPLGPHQAGRVRLEDEDWRAKSHESIPEKTLVTITAIDGVTLTVEKQQQKE